MAQKTRIKEITISGDKGTFSSFFKMFSSDKNDLNFDSISSLRTLLSNEKARILHVIRTKNPKSIYELAKLVNRDFKSVSEDINFLEKFGFIDLIKESSGKRERLRPVSIIDVLKIDIVL